MGSKLSKAKIGIVALNWKYDPSKMEDFVSRISAIGFKGIQISMDQANSREFLGTMEKYGLQRAEQYLDISCTVDGPVQAAEAKSLATIEAAASAGVEMIVFAVDGSPERERIAGRAHLGPALTDEGMQKLANHVTKYAQLAKEKGMHSSFHPHAATYIETTDETRKLMNLLDKDLVGLCLDVGHWIVGGGDVIATTREYGTRITHVHIKDVDGEVLRRMVAGEFETMHEAVVDHFLFTPAGEGVLPLQEFFQELNKLDFSRWMMSEQDAAREPAEEKSEVSYANIKKAHDNL